MSINVVYISNFMINIVSKSILEAKELYFDIKHHHLHRKEKAVFFAFRVKNYYVLKNNIKITANVFNAKVVSIIKFEISYKWHQLLAYASSEIIKHFAQVAEEVKIIDIKNAAYAVSKINKCKICALAKAHKIVSRFSAKAKTSDKLFFCITYDLIQLNAIMNKNQWISHIACFEYDFYLVFIHAHKLKAIEIFIKFINIIK